MPEIINSNRVFIALWPANDPVLEPYSDGPLPCITSSNTLTWVGFLQKDLSTGGMFERENVILRSTGRGMEKWDRGGKSIEQFIAQGAAEDNWKSIP